MLKKTLIPPAVWICFAIALAAGSAAAQPVVLTNAKVDLGAAPPTVTLRDLFDAFGTGQGQVWQVVDGDPVELMVVSWTAGTVVAELVSAFPGDYLLAVLPLGVPASQRALFTVTVPGDNPDAPCADSSTRFVNCGNGTVTDTVTGLVWLFQASCFGSKTYEEAFELAAELASGQCGLQDGSRPGDWRLATEEEWEAMVDLTCPNPPKIRGNGPSTGCYTANPWASGVQSLGFYWSATTVPSETTFAYGAYTAPGFVDVAFKPDFGFVWPVRSGP